jgi:putative transposase
MESLNVKGMIKNHKLAKHIADVGWRKFTDFVKYKSIWYGKKVVEIDQWFPSSQLCSECGYRNRDLTLNDREWVCLECGCVHDRDVNASINIKNQGLTILSGSWTDSDVKQKRLESLSNVSLRNNNEIDKAVKVEAPIL